MSQDITDFQGSDIIDVRDVIARVEELRSERDSLKEQCDDCVSAYEYHDGDDTKSTPEYDDMLKAKADLTEWENDNSEELTELEELLSSMCGYGGDEQWEGDWYPVTLIHENYFESAMDELLEDVGDTPKDLPSYLTITVDYDVLKQDYSEVEFNGDTYYYR